MDSGVDGRKRILVSILLDDFVGSCKFGVGMFLFDAWSVILNGIHLIVAVASQIPFKSVVSNDVPIRVRP